MANLDATALAGYHGVGPGVRDVTIALPSYAGFGISQVAIRSRVGTNNIAGIGVYSRIYTSSGEFLVEGGPQNAGDNGFGGVTDPGLSSIWATKVFSVPRTDITGLYFWIHTPDGSGWQGFGEVVRAEYTLVPVMGSLGMIL